MKIKQYKWVDFLERNQLPQNEQADLVFVYASRLILERPQVKDTIRKFFESSEMVYCSTAGEISNEGITENSLSVTAIKFEKTEVKTACVNIDSYNNSKEAARALAEKLFSDKLQHILVFADGQIVNGSELVEGLNHALPTSISVSGGLAGDDARFSKTLVGLNDSLGVGNIVGIGLYGHNLLIRNGSEGGWEPFGNTRKVTRSSSNKLFELDGMPALEVYKKYLGDLAAQLPGSALQFPLSVKIGEKEKPVTRTILSVDEAEQSLTFAGDVPLNSEVKLMKASAQAIIEAAKKSALSAKHPDEQSPELAILVSCVGRKIILGKKTGEEVENVKNTLGNKTGIMGFYSYGEIAPHQSGESACLHNQTMTITTISEI
jgi:hypothetical protein